MAFLRQGLPDAWTANEIPSARNGQNIQIAGLVICRQRPGTANGNLFISLEDETGISNVFVPAKTLEANRLMITQERFLIVEGPVQMSRGSYSVFARIIRAISSSGLKLGDSHDFH